MSNATATKKLSCDLLVIGSGAGGLSTAITAKKHGLDVIVVEKEEYFGGTTAFSGGVLWIPGNPHAKRDGIQDSRKDMITYMKDQTGNFYDEAAVTAFLDQGPEMVEFFERETEVKFLPTLYPDYHPDAPGGAAVGRSIVAEPYDLRGLGPEIARLRPPLTTITFIGMMFNSSNADLKHFFNAMSDFADRRVSLGSAGAPARSHPPPELPGAAGTSHRRSRRRRASAGETSFSFNVSRSLLIGSRLRTNPSTTNRRSSPTTLTSQTSRSSPWRGIPRNQSTSSGRAR